MLLSCVACIAMLMFRRPDAFMFPQFYAEDGKYFFADAFNDGWESLFYRANGYFHLFPRIVAIGGLSIGVPLRWMPMLFVLCTFSVYVLVWIYIDRRMPTSLMQRCFAIMATVLPPLGHEILMNMTNVQWMASLLIPLIIMGRPIERGAWVILDSVILIFVCTTGPYAVVWSPVLFYWGYGRWRKGSLTKFNSIYLLIIGSLVLVTVFSLLDFGSIDRKGSELGGSMILGGIQVLFRQLWYPLIATHVASVPLALQVIFTLIALTLIALLFRRLGKNDDPFGRMILITAGAFLAATLISYRNDLLSLSPIHVGMRNFYLPAVLLIWAALCVPLAGQKRMILAYGAALAWMGVATGLFLGQKDFVDLHWEQEVVRLDQGEERVVPLNPPGWSMQLNGYRSSDL